MAWLCQPLLRDVAFVLTDLWRATVRGLRIPQGKTQRDLAAPKVGHVAMVRSIACLRLGLTAHDEAGAAAHTLSRRLGFSGRQAEGGGAVSDSFLVTTAEPRLKNSRSWTRRLTVSLLVLISHRAARSQVLRGHRALLVFQL